MEPQNNLNDASAGADVHTGNLAQAALTAEPENTSAVIEPAKTDSETQSAAGEPGEIEEIQRVKYTALQDDGNGQPPVANIDYLKDVNLEAEVELGNATLSVDQILHLGVGSVVELNQTVGEPVRLRINHNVYAFGEVVVIGEKFGIRIGKLIRS